MDKRSYEMGYTPPEFKKALLGQYNSNTSYTITATAENAWSIEDVEESISVAVKIAVGAPRKIALLTLPVLNTEFTYIDMSEAQIKAFMKTFFKYFHKGGG